MKFLPLTQNQISNKVFKVFTAIQDKIERLEELKKTLEIPKELLITIHISNTNLNELKERLNMSNKEFKNFKENFSKESIVHLHNDEKLYNETIVLFEERYKVNSRVEEHKMLNEKRLSRVIKSLNSLHKNKYYKTIIGLRFSKVAPDYYICSCCSQIGASLSIDPYEYEINGDSKEYPMCDKCLENITDSIRYYNYY